MDTSQYLSMFLDESMDNLQTLNEALLNLEQNPNDIEMLNQIFRVAHTIKGMAATMGFSAMAELTHKMEDVLSNFREGKLEVSENVVTVLFNCLDTLETMVNNIEAGVEDEVDVTDIVQALENIVNGNEKGLEVVVENAEEGQEKEKKIKIELNQYDISIVRQVMKGGFNTLNVQISLSEETLLKSATESERVTAGMYRVGRATMLDWQQAQSELINAQKQNNSAKYDLIIKRAAVALAIGDIKSEIEGTINE